jgi:hypothetical protein
MTLTVRLAQQVGHIWRSLEQRMARQRNGIVVFLISTQSVGGKVIAITVFPSLFLFLFLLMVEGTVGTEGGGTVGERAEATVTAAGDGCGRL